jgi:hypothetical protein
LHNTGSSASASCPAIGGDSPSDDGLSASRLFAPGSYVSGTGGGTVPAGVITACAHPYTYGNYDPATGTFSNGIRAPCRPAAAPSATPESRPATAALAPDTRPPTIAPG